MNYYKLTSPSEVTRLLKKYNFKCQKYLGQNFLIDQNILKKIIDSLQLNKEESVFEIGTGIGTLTSALSPLVKKVISIEKDEKLIPILHESLAPYNNINVIFQDVMNYDLINFFQESNRNREKVEKIVGNLPYYISLPLIKKILELNKYIKLAILLVQKEVGERLIAKVGSKEYGILSLATQYYSLPEKIHLVPPSVFYPPPKVNSMLISLKIHSELPVKINDEKLFFNIIKASFQQRRKNLINSLSNYFRDKIKKTEIENILKKIEIDGNRRGETLTLEEFTKLSIAIGENIK